MKPIKGAMIKMNHGINWHGLILALAAIPSKAICNESISLLKCDSTIDSVSMLYEQRTTILGLFQREESQFALDLGFHEGELTSWRGDSGDLIKSHLAIASGCGVILPDSQLCSVGIWNESNDCLFSGITASAYPTHIIYHFAGTNDFLFVFVKTKKNQTVRQISIYRQDLGSFYSLTLTGNQKWYSTSEEWVLKESVINGKKKVYDFNASVAAIREHIKPIEGWIKKLTYNDVIGGTKRIEWEVLKKAE